MRLLRQKTKTKPQPLTAIAVVAEIQDTDQDWETFSVRAEKDGSSYQLFTMSDNLTDDDARQIKEIREVRSRFSTLRLELLKALGGERSEFTPREREKYDDTVRSMAVLRAVAPELYAKADPVRQSFTPFSSYEDRLEDDALET